MRERGRASIITIGGIVSAILIVALFFLAKESPSTAAARFLDALARTDAKTLAQNSFIEGKSEADLEKAWEKTLYVTRYFKFGWRIAGQQEQSDNRAAVIVFVIPDLEKPDAYEQKQELPMVRQDGHWRVDLRRLSRAFYPALPK
jgi:hypothetical protein